MESQEMANGHYIDHHFLPVTCLESATGLFNKFNNRLPNQWQNGGSVLSEIENSLEEITLELADSQDSISRLEK